MADVTIQDVARAAGVSATSVSNLLNGRHDRMRSDTRQRIETVISQLGYRPNPIARQLKTGRTSLLGLLVPTVANPFYGELAVTIERCAQEYGYHLLLCNTLREAERETEFIEQLMTMGVRAFIMVGSPANLDHVREIVSRGVAITALDVTLGELATPGVDVVSIDNSGATCLAVDHLVSLGHRRIAFATAPVTTSNRRARLRGYREGLAAHGLGEGTILLGSSPRESSYGDLELAHLGREAGREVAMFEDRPTAIVAYADMLALGVMTGLSDYGLDVPRDVSVIGLDDIRIASFVKPPLTTIRQPSRRMAEVAVQRLMERVAEPGKPASEHIVRPELVLRATAVPPY